MAADPNAAFAASLRDLRAKRGLSKAALAKLAGISPDRITCIENETDGTTLATAGLLAKALGTTPAEMLAGTPSAAATRSAEPFAITDHDGALLRVVECAQDQHGYLEAASEDRAHLVFVCVEPQQVPALAAALYRAAGQEEMAERALTLLGVPRG